MDRSVAWRAALLQGVSVAVLAVPLALALPDSFFADWGWLAGPAVWGLCALGCAAVLRLPVAMVLAGAALCGLLSLATVASGVHWAGVPFAVLAFGAWCGWLAARRERDRPPAARGSAPTEAAA